MKSLVDSIYLEHDTVLYVYEFYKYTISYYIKVDALASLDNLLTYQYSYVSSKVLET